MSAPRVGLDKQLAIGTATGVGEYVRGLHAALVDRGVAVTALAAPGYDPWRFDRRVVWDQVLLPLAARRARVDVLHCASGTMPLLVGMPTVVTVHDVAWLRVQGHVRAYARRYFGPFALARYRRAARVIVDSRFSRDELLAVARLDPGRIDVVYPGVARDVMSVARARDDASPFVLAVGTVEPRKNLEVVVRALASLPTLRLVSVGPPTAYRERCLELARELGVAERVDIRGYVPRADVLALYAAALAAVVPSTYEGFGYGAAQALCAGVPLVAADASSLPEVVAGDAAIVAPHDVRAWVEALAALAADPEAAERHASDRRDAARARFGWDAAARDVAAVYARTLDQ